MSIVVIKFETVYEEVGSETVARDWVLYAPRHAAQTTATWARVDHITPPAKLKRDTMGVKGKHMQAVWSEIGPAYEAWRSGQELPTTGTALEQWPALSHAQVEAFKRAGIRTIEDVRDMVEAQITLVKLPDVRGLKRQATAFLDVAKDSKGAKELANLRKEMDALKAQHEEALKMLAEAGNSGDPLERDEIKAELDALGIEYDGRASTKALASLLAGAKAEAA